MPFTAGFYIEISIGAAEDLTREEISLPNHSTLTRHDKLHQVPHMLAGFSRL